METNQVLLLLGVIVAVISTGSALRCYECNVWKAGYGHLCESPRVRDDCEVCMKTETTIYMGYYKNVPRSSTIVTRICARSRTVRFSNVCRKKDIPGGTAIACYCDNDLCNAATSLQRTTTSTVLALVSACVALVVNRMIGGVAPMH